MYGTVKVSGLVAGPIPAYIKMGTSILAASLNLFKYDSSSIGGIGLFGGGTSEFLIWLANPFYFIALFLFAKNKKVSILFILISSLLAISFARWKEILISESGSTAKIISFSSGYYLWVASIIVLFLAIIYHLRKDSSSL